MNLPGIVNSVHNSFLHYFLPNRHGLLTSNRHGLLTPNRHGLLTPLPSQTRNSPHSLDTVSASLRDGLAASPNLYGFHSTIGLLTLQISADF
jgi:hypothetical protein